MSKKKEVEAPEIEHPQTDQAICYYENRAYIEYLTWRGVKVGKKDRPFFSNLCTFCEEVNMEVFDWILIQLIEFREFDNSKIRLRPHHLLTPKAVQRTYDRLEYMKKTIGVNGVMINAAMELQSFLDRIRACKTKFGDVAFHMALMIGLNQKFLNPPEFDYAWTKNQLPPNEPIYVEMHDSYRTGCVDKLRSLVLKEEI